MATPDPGTPPPPGGTRRRESSAGTDRSKKAAADVFDAFFGSAPDALEASEMPTDAADRAEQTPTPEPPPEPTSEGLSVVIGTSGRAGAADQRQRAADELARTLAEFEATGAGERPPTLVAKALGLEPGDAPSPSPTEAAAPVEPAAPEPTAPEPTDPGPTDPGPTDPDATVTVPLPPEQRPAPDDAPDVPSQPRRTRRSHRRPAPTRTAPAAADPAADAPLDSDTPTELTTELTAAPEVTPERHQHVPIPDQTPAAVARRTEFKPRRALRGLLGLLVLLALVAAAATSWLAWETQENRDVVFAGIMVALAFVLGSIRATINPIDLIIEGGQLYVRQGHLREVHDLTSAYTDVTISGDPASTRWEVVISRFDAPTRRIGHDVVDGKAFVPVVLYWRPDAVQVPRASR